MIREIEKPLSSVKWDARFLALAEFFSRWSKDPSTKVGAVIVDDRRRVVSLGFNGFPQAMPDRQADYDDRDQKYSRIVHAEINAILLAGRSVEGMTLYTYPFVPCDRCAVQVIQAGIRRVVSIRPTTEQLARWGTAFEKTRMYFNESGIAWAEVEKDYYPSDTDICHCGGSVPCTTCGAGT